MLGDSLFFFGLAFSSVGDPQGRLAKSFASAVLFRSRTLEELPTYHRLDGAFARVERANAHIEHLRHVCVDMQQIYFDSIVLNFDPRRPNEPPQPTIGSLPAPAPIIGILIGEAVYNLRAALDYLAHELALLDSKSIQKTQFPICDRHKDFWKDGKAKTLPGVSDAHIAAIEVLQPYKGCAWTKTLRDLSNPDKHREITVARGQFSLTVFDKADRLRFLDLGGSVKSAKNPHTGEEVQVQMHATHEVLLREGGYALPALEHLKTQVALTLESFEPEF